MKQRIHEILEADQDGDWLSQVVDVLLMLLIVSNVTAIIISTDESIYGSVPPGFFSWFEGVSFAIFAAEYALRVWVCTVDPQYAHPVKGRLRFALQPLMLADAVAVASYYVILALAVSGIDLGAFRALRLITRMARMARYSPGLRALASAITARKNELLGVVSVVGALLVLASSLMYFAEHSAQPDKFPSIPATMWWGIITVTTVGYGDVAPITPAGRLLAGVIALLGIGIFALPAGILGSSFMEQVNQRRSPPVARTCPHCGQDIDAPPSQ